MTEWRVVLEQPIKLKLKFYHYAEGDSKHEAYVFRLPDWVVELYKPKLKVKLRIAGQEIVAHIKKKEVRLRDKDKAYIYYDAVIDRETGAKLKLQHGAEVEAELLAVY